MHICILLWNPFNSSFFGQAVSFAYLSLAVRIYHHVLFLHIEMHCVDRVFEANSHLVNKVSAFHAIPKFIFMFLKTYLSCSTHIGWIHSTSLYLSYLTPVFRRVRNIAKSDCRFVTFVCRSALNKSAPSGWFFMKFIYFEYFSRMRRENSIFIKIW